MTSLFSGPPSPKPPAPMPDSESPLALEARRKRMAEMLGRGGRQSTIMSGGDGSQAPYSDTKLGPQT